MTYNCKCHHLLPFPTCEVKTSGAHFFTALIQLNVTTNTLILDRPARFLFFARLQNILMKFSLTWRYPFYAPIYRTLTGLVSGLLDCFMFTFVVNLSSFLFSLVYIGVYHFTTIKIYPRTVKKIPAPRLLACSRPDLFPGSWTVPRIKQNTSSKLNFFPGCTVQSGDP